MQIRCLSNLTQQFSKKFKNKRLDNRGASLVMVLMVMALIFVLVSIILMITVTNLFMKDAAEKNTKNFYDAESSMDEIKAGLAEVCGQAYYYALGESQGSSSIDRNSEYYRAYAEYVYNSIAIPGHDTSIPNNGLQRQYSVGSFASSSGDTRAAVGKSYYSRYDGLANCLKGTSKAAIAKRGTSADGTHYDIGGEVLNTDAAGSNFINCYPDTGEVVLKNVQVQYTDDHDYVTKIETDIRLVCPSTNIQETTSLNNILYYTIITDNSVKLTLGNGSNDFQGNMFVGYQDSEINGTNLNLRPGGVTTNGQICYFIGGGNLKLDGTSTLSVNNSQMWVKGIKLGDRDSTTSNSFNFLAASGKENDSKLYLQDDLNLYANSSVSLQGQLIGFGNPNDLADNTAYSHSLTKEDNTTGTYTGTSSLAINNNNNLPSQTKREHATTDDDKVTIAEDINKKPYEYSSAILLNGKSCSVDLSQLTAMSLAGNAYVNANPTPAGSSDNADIRTGESISIKPSQRAYLFPAENLSFKANPVSGGAYTHMRAAMAEKIYQDAQTENRRDANNRLLYPSYSANRANPLPTKPVKADDGKVTGFEIDIDNIEVDTEDYIVKANDTETATDWLDFQASGFGKTFRELGVDGIRIAAYSTGHSPVMYFFMHFKDDKSANDFFTQYYANLQNKETLAGRLSLFTTSGVGIKLPDSIAGRDEAEIYDTDNFYFNGNFVVTNKQSANILGNDTFTELSTKDPSGSGASGSAQAKEKEILESSGLYYDNYFAMLTDLSTSYDNIPAEDLRRTVFENIIDERMLEQAVRNPATNSSIGDDKTNKRYYVSDTGKGAILCHNTDGSSNEITISATDIDVLEALYTTKYPSGGTVSLNLIVSDTDIKIAPSITDYKGLILAKGKVTIDHPMTIEQDAASVIVAMNAVHYAQRGDNKTEGYIIEQPREVFYHPEAYVVGGMNVTGSPSQEGVITTPLPSLVTYENWVRE